MTINSFYERTTLITSILILNNLILIAINIPNIFLKINLIIFFILLLFFYFIKPKENLYLKIFFILILLISLGTPTFEWDPRSIWLFHAKRIFYDGSIFSIVDNYASFSHNDYPNLVPALASSLATLVGHWNEVFPKIAFTLMFFPPLLISYIFFKDVKYLIFLCLVLFFIGKYLFTGWADGLVAVYFGLSSLLMYFLVIDENNPYRKNKIYYLIASCFFILLTLIKNEGFALLFILFISTFLVNFYKKKLNKNLKNLIYLSSCFIPILLWKYFCYSNGIGNDYINTNIFTNLLPRISNYENYYLIFYYLLLNEKFLFALTFFLIVFWIKKDNELFIFVFLNAFIYITTLFLIFLSTPLDFYFQLDSTATRVIKTLSFLLAFFGLHNINITKQKLL